MRVLILGGTRFIGRAVAEELHGAGHDLCFVHRGRTEPPDLPPGEHVHVDRADIAGRRRELEAFEPAALVDAWAMSRADADALVPLAREIPTVVLSSADVYRAYSSLQRGEQDEPVPLGEDSPTRDERYPYSGMDPAEGAKLGVDVRSYEKLDVEEAYLAARATVLRLPFVFGERDPQRREDFVLRRVRAGRAQIPIGTASTLFTRGYVRDVARGVRRALETPAARGEVFNLGEPRTVTVRAWAERILAAAGARTELVPVPDERLPADLALTAGGIQHLLLDSAKARAVLGYETTDPDEALRRSVAWHMANPPDEPHDDWAEDDRALPARG